jgi:hypothetical protein
MSIIPVNRLSSSDLAILGNNVRPPAIRKTRRRRRRYDRFIDAVNRSLASTVDETVTRLHRPLLAAA